MRGFRPSIRGLRKAAPAAAVIQTTEPEPPPAPIEPSDSLPPVNLETLPPMLRDAALRVGWATLMPVQERAIPYLLAGRDLMVQSRTGSGKTGAFVLPILGRVDPARATCQALVLVPTRELARQVAEAAEGLGEGSGVRVAAIYGGVGYEGQLNALSRGAHLVVGTPGRILDHLMRGSLSLASLRVLVFDEADRMLSVGFYPDMVKMAGYLPRQRDGFMFSATYPPGVLSLAGEFLREPEFLSLSHGVEHVAETEHVAYEVSSMEKPRALIRIIELQNPESAIVFCNTKAQVEFVSKVLRNFGYDAEPVSGDLTQSERDRVLARTYQKNLRFLVATDLAGRGIDIPSLSHVILYDFPEDPEAYIHRTGRTGRAGASGEAISLVDLLEKLALADVVRRYGIDLQWRPVPTTEEVEAIVSERVTALLEQRVRELTPLIRERMQRMLPLARRLGENDDELALMAMLLDDYYQATLHAPAEVPERPPAASSGSPVRGRSERRSREERGGRGEGGRGGPGGSGEAGGSGSPRRRGRRGGRSRPRSG